MKDKGKITIAQVFLLLLTFTYSATMRAIPIYAINKAKQAAWLTPVVPLIVFVLLYFIIKSFVTKFPDQSFGDIVCKILGRPIGKILIVIYILWFMILLGLYLRYFDERLLSSIYPNVDMRVFIAIFLVVIGIVVRSGIVAIARMNKIIFTILLAQFLLILILMMNKIEVHHITPISQLDIMPILQGSVGVAGIWVYLFFIFTFSDKIQITKKFNKGVMFSAIFLFVATTASLILMVGVFGANTAMQLPLPLLSAVKNISKQYSGLEALFLSIWTLADFITVGVFIYITLRLLKSLFGLKNPMPLISIMVIFIFFLAQFMTNEIFELQAFTAKLGLPFNVILGLGVPIIIFLVGKVRKKL